MDDTIQQALAHSQTIDITTIGRRTGQPRRIEIVVHNFDGRLYISGKPRADRRRSWLANLEAHPGPGTGPTSTGWWPTARSWK